MTATGFEEFLVGNDDESDDGMSIGIESDIRYCACGCGTVLPSTYKWSYKRGHKLAGMSAEVEADPDRPDFGDTKSASYSSTRITKKMKDDIEGQCGMLLMIVTMGIAVRDPICGEAFTENADKIAEKMVPIICKSPSMVKWLTKSSNFKDYIELFLAVLPVLKVVGSHHILHQESLPGNLDTTPVQLYPAG